MKAIIHDEEQRVQREGARLVVYREQTSNPDLSATDRENSSCDPPLAIRLAAQPSQLREYEPRYHAHGNDTTNQEGNGNARRNPTSSIISTNRANESSIKTQRQLTHEISLEKLNVTSEQEEVIENALIEGIKKVFDKYICGAIRRVSVQSDRITSWRASVTMVFPLWGGLVNCLMSLDVCE